MPTKYAPRITVKQEIAREKTHTSEYAQHVHEQQPWRVVPGRVSSVRTYSEWVQRVLRIEEREIWEPNDVAEHVHDEDRSKVTYNTADNSFTDIVIITSNRSDSKTGK